jgi:hypothetical protein
VIHSGEGWSIAILAENGENRQLLKPGWKGEKTASYQFPTEQAAWNFLKQMFNFCLQQSRMQHTASEKIKNCGQCGAIFKATVFDHCHRCLQENEFVLQQIWQGFYYLAGSEKGALQKAAFLLKIPYEEFAQVPDAFQAMVQRHLELNMALEKAREERLQQQKVVIPGSEQARGLRSHTIR